MVSLQQLILMPAMKRALRAEEDDVLEIWINGSRPLVNSEETVDRTISQEKG